LKIIKEIFKVFRNDGKEKPDNPFVHLEIYNNSSTPVYLIDESFNIIWSNEEFNKLKSNPTGQKCFNVLFNTEFICENCPAIVAIRETKLSHSVVQSSKKHHKVVATKIISNPVSLDNKIYALNFVQNIRFEPKDKSLQEESPSSAKSLFEFLEYIPIPCLLLDLHFNILKFNLVAQGVLGLDTQKIYKLKDILDWGSEIDFDKFLTNLLNSKSQTISGIIKAKEKDSHIPAICHFSQISTDDKLILLVIEPNEKISQKELKEIEKSEVLQLILENLPIGIQIQTDLSETFVQNQKARQLLESDRNILNEIRKANILGETGSFVFEFEKDGKKCKVSTYTIQSKFTNKNFRVFLFEDITEFDKILQELKKYQSLVEQTTKFLQIVSFTIDSEFYIENIIGKIEGVIGENHNNQVNERVKFSDLVHSEDSFKVNEVLAELFHFPDITRELDFRVKRGEEDTLWMKGFFANEVDERGKIQRVNCVLFEINEQKKVEEQLKSSQEEMRNLALYFESLREEEKKKLAFEIHDELGHLLTAMKLEMSWILKKKYLREDVLHEKLIKLIEMVETTIKKVRSISSQLRPSILDHFGIVAAIEWQAKEFQRQTAIRCRINLTRQDVQLDEAKSIVVFRVFQEILTNIARHANATRVDVSLQVEDNNLVLIVSDNGKGIKQEDMVSKRSLGITGMKERANSVNGKLTIQGVSNVGTTVTLTIPIN
jgi:signal transduction histidine kinase